MTTTLLSPHLDRIMPGAALQQAASSQDHKVWPELVCLRPGPNADLQLQQTSVKEPGRGQIVVRAQATSLNPIDVKRARGYGQRLFKLIGAAGRELVLGNDFVGIVVKVGADISQFCVGDSVFGTVKTGPQGGAHRSFLTVDASLARRLPSGVTPYEAAVLPYTFCTLWQALEALNLNANSAHYKRVLIQGGSSALGQLATQLLTLWGAHVSVVASKRHEALCNSLGAEAVIDRHTQRVVDLPANFDATLNFGSWDDEPALVQRLSPSALGHAAAVHPLVGDLDELGWIRGSMRIARQWLEMRRLARSRSRQARYSWVLFKPSSSALDLLCELLARDRLSLKVAFAVPFSQARAAFQHVEAGNPQRVVLYPDSDIRPEGSASSEKSGPVLV